MSNQIPALQRDLADESKAIKDYGERIKQSKGHGFTSTLREIQGDEKDHHRKIAAILAGLKSCERA